MHDIRIIMIMMKAGDHVPLAFVLHAGSEPALPVVTMAGNSGSGILHASTLAGKVPSMTLLLEACGPPGDLSNLPGFGLVPPN